jgi:hypothetical protein
LLEGFLKMQDTETDGSIPYAPPPDGKKWATPPEDGDKYRALVALSRLDLCASELKLAIVLIDRANPRTGRCDPGTDCLVADTGLSERTIERARPRLRKRGIISYRLRGLTSASYQVNWHKLREIFWRQCRTVIQDGKPVVAHLKTIEQAWRGSPLTPEQKKTLDRIVEEHGNGDDVREWARHLKGE